MSQVLAGRMQRVRDRMDELGVEATLLSVGPDLPYLTGYEAMPLERLTMLVVPAGDEAVLFVPRLEAPRVVSRPDLFRTVAWDETDDPVALVADTVDERGELAVGDRTWARFLIELQSRLPGARWRRAAEVLAPLRARKDPAEVEMLRRAGAAVDRIAAQLQHGEIELLGRTEAQVSAEIGRRILDEGHQRVNFAIVAAGPNAASPHHEPDDTVIGRGDVVLCDFGGTMVGDDGVGYCSDITRCVSLGSPGPEVARAYEALLGAQAAAVAAAVVGTPCEQVDATARGLLVDAGYGEAFIHRTGHGIGVEEHEDPYIVSGNTVPLAAGHAFSVEPGIYLAGRFGLRLEDIVVATDHGPDPMNRADHHLAVV